MAGCSFSNMSMLALGLLIGTLPCLFQQFSPNNSIGIASESTVSQQVDCTTQSNTQEPQMTHPNWCPNARCTNTDLCHPCQRRFLIVVATPRSASTTLTWMLNELPGLRMSGENNNHLDMVWQMHSNLWNHTSFLKSEDKKAAWGHNYIPPQTFACAAQATVEAINPPALVDQKTISDPAAEKRDIIGFKTIRFERGANRNYTEMVELVKEQFPCSRVLFNINSNVTRQAESFKAANFFQISASSLHRRNDQMREIYELFGSERAYWTDSSEWTKDVRVLNDAVEWLGFHPSCRFQELLEFNTAGGHGFQNAKETLSHRSADCRAIE